MKSPYAIPGDWHNGVVPENVKIGEGVYIETSYCFDRFLSRHSDALRLGRGASVYGQTIFDLGPDAQATVGEFTLINSARITCDREIRIGSHCLFSWNVMVMDSRRAPLEPAGRARLLQQAIGDAFRWPTCSVTPRPVSIGHNVWIGFDSVILPGVTIGEGSVIGARSVVFQDIPAYRVAAGNPARVVRRLPPPTEPHLE